MKKEYCEPEVIVIQFQDKDIIATSIGESDDDDDD